jgi:hypothetical protein
MTSMTEEKCVKTMTLGELAAEFERLTLSKKRISVQESELNVSIDEVQSQLLELMGENGLQNLKTEAGMTLYRRTDKYPGVAEGYTKEQLIQELGRHPQTMDLVSPNYNANSLRSRLKEIEDNGELLPEELERMIKIIEKDKIGHK